MDSTDVDSIFRLVTVELKLVTVKVCRDHLGVDSARAKMLMKKAVEEHRDRLCPIFAVLTPDSGAKKFSIRLVEGTEEAEKLGGAMEIYAIANGKLSCPTSACSSTNSTIANSSAAWKPSLASLDIAERPATVPSSKPSTSKPSTSAVSTVSKPSTSAVSTVSKPSVKATVSSKAPATSSLANAFAKSKPTEATKPATSKKENSKISKVVEVDDDECEVIGTLSKAAKTKGRKKRIIEDDDDSDDAAIRLAIEDENTNNAVRKTTPIPMEVSTPPKKKQEPLRKSPRKSPPNPLVPGGSAGKKAASVNVESPEKPKAAVGGGERKLVNVDSYVDEEGYFVTKKVWQHEDESADPKRSPAKKPVENTKKAPAPKKIVKSKDEGPGKPKQTSLTSFFKKA